MKLIKMKNSKCFFITIDTEADNQWDNEHDCTTKNSKYLPRFQELAEKYGYKPTWLTTFEMANDDFYLKYFKKKQEADLCEIGMHLHAWNTPPNYELKKTNNNRSYLIEYPKEIMEEKIICLDNLLTSKFGIKPISHRAGRWAMDNDYFQLLYKHGYKVDCSITPHIDWTNNLGATGLTGSNYNSSSEKEIFINNSILEIPMTIRLIHYFDTKKIKNLKSLIREVISLLTGKKQWIRPDKFLSINGIKKVIDKCNSKGEYIMFMIHSSELMPGGSPNFQSEEDIEKLYDVIEKIFKYSKELGYEGKTLREYYDLYYGGEKNEK